jgi:hypothetical protein
MPERRGIPPGYEQKHFEAEEKQGRLWLVASRDGRDGSITVNQDVYLYAALFKPGARGAAPAVGLKPLI